MLGGLLAFPLAHTIPSDKLGCSKKPSPDGPLDLDFLASKTTSQISVIYRLLGLWFSARATQMD